MHGNHLSEPWHLGFIIPVLALIPRVDVCTDMPLTHCPPPHPTSHPNPQPPTATHSLSHTQSPLLPVSSNCNMATTKACTPPIPPCPGGVFIPVGLGCLWPYAGAARHDWRPAHCGGGADHHNGTGAALCRTEHLQGHAQHREGCTRRRPQPSCAFFQRCRRPGGR